MNKKIIDLFKRQKVIWRLQREFDSMANNKGDNYSHILIAEIKKFDDGSYGECLQPELAGFWNWDYGMTYTKAISRYESCVRELFEYGIRHVCCKEIEDVDDYLKSHQVIRVRNSSPRWNDYYVCLDKSLVKQFRVSRLLFLLEQKLIRPFRFLKAYK